MFGRGKSFLPDHFDHPALVRIDDISAKKNETGARMPKHRTPVCRSLHPRRRERKERQDEEG